MSVLTSSLQLWVPHPTEEWSLAFFLQDDAASKGYMVENIDGTSRQTVDKGKTCVLDASHLIDLDNLCSMNNLHEAPLLDILRRRFKKDLIYTFTGDVLISVNPYHIIDGLVHHNCRHSFCLLIVVQP